MRQALDILDKVNALGLLLQQLGARPQDRDGRTQFMRGVRQEAIVPVVTLGKARKRLVEGVDQRCDFLGHALDRELHRPCIDIDARGLVGGVDEAGEGTANDRGCRHKGRHSHDQNNRQEQDCDDDRESGKGLFPVPAAVGVPGHIDGG